METSLAARNGVTAVSQAVLVLAISGRERAASWSMIGSVVARVAASGNGELFVLALAVDDGEASRPFTVAETERIWPELTTMLPVGLWRSRRSSTVVRRWSTNLGS